MADPYVGEIRMFAGNFPPAGWAVCDGQMMAISENDTLFTLIGTTYGGDGQEKFALPDLRGRVPVHQGQGPGISQNYVIGEAAGVDSVTLSTQQMPVHNHAAVCSTSVATLQTPQSAVLAQSTLAKLYYADATDATLAPGTVGMSGGSQPHDNMQPYLAVTYIISLYGIFPSQT